MALTSDRRLEPDLATAIGFAASRAIEAGLLDGYLHRLASDIRWRQALTNREKVPRKTADMRASGHQVWAWINAPDGKGGQWEVRGTGAILTDEQLADARTRREGTSRL